MMTETILLRILRRVHFKTPQGCLHSDFLQVSLAELREEQAAVAGLLEGGDLVVGVTQLAARAEEAEQLRRDGVALAEGVAVQLRERDSAHTERVRSLEILMAEKEKQLLAGANLVINQFYFFPSDLSPYHTFFLRSNSIYRSVFFLFFFSFLSCQHTNSQIK